MDDGPVEFRRSAGSRAGAVVSAGVAGAFLAALALGGGLGAGPLGVAALVVAAAAALALVSAFGDRYRLDGDGIAYSNAWLRRGPFAPRRIAWGEIEAVRVWRGRVLAIRPARGARLVIDAVEGFAELRDRVVRASGLERAGPAR